MNKAVTLSIRYNLVILSACLFASIIALCVRLTCFAFRLISIDTGNFVLVRHGHQEQDIEVLTSPLAVCLQILENEHNKNSEKVHGHKVDWGWVCNEGFE